MTPTEPRLPLLDPEAARAAAVEVGVPEGYAELSVFRVLLRHPELARSLEGLLGRLLWRGTLDARLRELAIMRIAWKAASDYEWTQHWRVSIGLGIAESDLEAVRRGPDDPRWSGLDEAVLRAVDETVDDDRISEPTWGVLASHLGESQLLELVVAIGHWRLYAGLLRSLRIPLEDGVASWPPDGLAPPGADA